MARVRPKYRGLVVKLTEEEYRELCDQAEEQFRTPDQQLRYLLLVETNRRAIMRDIRQKASDGQAAWNGDSAPKKQDIDIFVGGGEG